MLISGGRGQISALRGSAGKESGCGCSPKYLMIGRTGGGQWEVGEDE